MQAVPSWSCAKTSPPSGGHREEAIPAVLRTEAMVRHEEAAKLFGRSVSASGDARFFPSENASASDDASFFPSENSSASDDASFFRSENSSASGDAAFLPIENSSVSGDAALRRGPQSCTRRSRKAAPAQVTIAPIQRKARSAAMAVKPSSPRQTRRNPRQKWVSGNASERRRTPGGS
jgi:hypothetical protein